MTVPNRRHIIPWLLVVVLAGASLGLGIYRLSALPNLGMTLGPDLGIRSVTNPNFSKSDTPKFKRGDRLVALEGHSLEDLRDLRVVLRSVPTKRKLGLGENNPGMRFQIVRPLHRYTIALQGEHKDPTSLPPGYNPKTDRLVEIDGRPLPDEVGPEGVRSIVGSRPDALLTFERRNAVFKGHVAFEESNLTTAIGICFGLVIAIVLVLWRFHSRKLYRWSPLAVSVETLAFGWVVLLTLAHQWLLADHLLASFVVAALVLTRPLALFARSKAVRHGSDASGWWALGIGVGFAALIVGLMHGGVLENPEMALFGGASAAGLYVVYELFLVAFDEAPFMTLQEGGGYLAGILIVGMALAIFSWNFQPIAFNEVMWRWFTIGFLALVWFGDALFCIRGPTSAGYGDVVTSEERRESIRQYLHAVQDEIAHSRVMVVVHRQEVSLQVGLDDGELAFERTDDPVADMVSILLQEKARIPLPDTVDRASHPLNGIAQTMNIVLALRLQPPSGGIHLPDTDLVLIAIEESDAGELPSYASSETIDFAQRELSPGAWAAIFVEGMAQLSEFGADVPTRRPSRTTAEAELDVETADDERDGRDRATDSDAAPSDIEEKLSEVESDLDDARERIDLLREDRRELAGRLQGAEERIRRMASGPDNREDLLEPALVETLEYLLESDAPVVIGGPYGAGKEFVARYASANEGYQPESFVVYDAFDDPSDEQHVALFGRHGEDEAPPGEGLIETAVETSLLVRSAERLSDTLLTGLCNSAEERDFRLFLSFNESEIEERSVLDGRRDNLVDRLEHRELMIPSLYRRKAILPDILNYYLELFARLRERRISGFTDRAMEALSAYDYPAEIREAQLQVDLALLRTKGREVGLSSLSLDIQSSFENSSTSVNASGDS